jgi:nucleotide-binding universal stress UspA family protein
LAPFDRILVPVGPAATVERALAVALDLVGRTGVPLHLLSVSRPIQEQELAARVATLTRAGAPAPHVETRVVAYGPIAAAITAAAEPGTLVCMSSHGAYGPARTLAAPSITEDVLRSAAGPVLVVGPRVASDASLDGRVVACLDGTHYSEHALAAAQQWSRAFGLPLWLVQVGPARGSKADTAGQRHMPPELRLDALARSLGGVEGWQVLPDGRQARALAALSETTPVAVFVMATHGRTGWARILGGSVTASTVRRARAPILVVPARRRGRRGPYAALRMRPVSTSR